MGREIGNKYFSGKAYWLFPLFIALGIRFVYFTYWSKAPFRLYHNIRGLDMYTIYNLSFKSESSSSLYYLTLKVLGFFVDPGSVVSAMIIIQLIMGVISVLLVVYICRVITGSKLAASLSGIIYSLYSPLLLYEGFLLKETFYIFFSLTAMAWVIYVREKDFEGWLGMTILGLLLPLPLFVRSIGLIWFIILFLWTFYHLFNCKIKTEKYGRKFSVITKLIFMILGVLLISSFVYRVNGRLIPNAECILPNYRYFLKVGLQKDIDSVNLKKELHKGKNLVQTAGKDVIEQLTQNNLTENIYSCKKKAEVYLAKFLMLLNSYEVPNNINYYFIKNHLFPLKYLIGPFLLFPFAFIGLVLFVFYRSRLRYVGIVFLSFIPVLVAGIVFLPLARFRIALVPTLAVTAGFFISEIWGLYYKKKFFLFALFLFLLVAVFTAEYLYKGGNYYRSTDYIAYAQALRLQNSDDKRVLENFAIAYSMRPDKENARKNFIGELLTKGHFKLAENILAEEYKKMPSDFYIAINYTASLLGSKKIEKAYRILKNIKEPQGKEQKLEYFYNWGEYYFLTKDYQNSLKFYKKAFGFIDKKDVKLKNYINKKAYIIKSFLTGNLN